MLEAVLIGEFAARDSSTSSDRAACVLKSIGSRVQDHREGLMPVVTQFGS
jgi:hypothetical protein